MDIAHIVPPRLVEQFEPGRIAMIYVDWVLDHDRGTGYHYVDYWKEAESTYKILDHSLFELMRFPLDTDTIVMAADVIEPDEVVLPDRPGRGSDTLGCSKSLLLALHEREWLKAVMFVPQGSSWEDWTRCYQSWTEFWIKEGFGRQLDLTIGLAATRKSGSLRPDQGLRGRQVTYLLRKGVSGSSIHLLGMHPWWFANYELPVAWAAGVRSMDTSLPYVLGSQGKLLARTAPQGFLHFLVGDITLLSRELALALLNMKLLEYWCDTGAARTEIPVSVLEETIRLVANDPIARHEDFLPLAQYLDLAGLPRGEYAANYRAGRLHSVRPIWQRSSPDEGYRKVTI